MPLLRVSCQGRRTREEEKAGAGDRILLVLCQGRLAGHESDDRLGKISVDHTPTDYFTREEFEKIVDATYLYRENRWEQGDRNGSRLRALCLLMRWSGLRIRDAVTLERSRLVGDSLLLYQAKTRTRVYVPLPPDVADALRNAPPGNKPNPRYFFRSGNGLPKSAVADWQQSRDAPRGAASRTGFHPAWS